MKVAIISDIHENFHNLTLFFKEIEGRDIKKIIFLGDFINNWIAKMLAWSKIPVYAIWGNNDGDKVAITKTSLSQGSNLEVWFATFDVIDIWERKVFITHYPMLARPMAKSGDFDAVFCGHDHKCLIENIDSCLLVNPGEVSAHKTKKATFAIYDSETNKAKLIELSWSITVKSDLADKHREESGFVFSKSRSHWY